MLAPKPDSDGVVQRAITRAADPPSRYDLVLAILPLLFVVAVVASEVGALPTREALAAAGLVGAAVLADALFVNPPQDPT